jgi:hypothetical protein
MPRLHRSEQTVASIYFQPLGLAPGSGSVSLPLSPSRSRIADGVAAKPPSISQARPQTQPQPVGHSSAAADSSNWGLAPERQDGCVR